MKLSLLVLSISLIASTVYGGVIDVSSLNETRKIGHQLLIFQDKEIKQSIESVAQMPESQFESGWTRTPNFGFKPYPFWARMILDNPSSEEVTVYLKYNFAIADYIDLFTPTQDGFKVQNLGDRTPYRNQTVQARVPTFQIKVPPGTHTYHLRLETLGSNVFPVTIASEMAFKQELVDESLLLALLLGIILAMTGYNLFLFISFRTKIYLYYVVYMLTFTLYQFGLQGLSRMYFGEDHTHHWFSNEGILVNTELYNVVMILFTIEFLNLREKMPKLAKFFTWYRVFQIANIILCQFVSYEIGAKTASASVLFTMSFMSYAGIRSALRGYRPAYFYTLAFGLVLIGNAVIAMKFRGYLSFNWFTDWIQIVGGAAEALLLSLALGDRVNYYRSRSDAKIKALNQELKNHIQNVEEIVEDKTRDIRSMMDNIPQGIFTIHPPKNADEGGLIDKDYSLWLENFLGTQNLEDASIVDVLFKKSDLSKDEINQVSTVLYNSLGEDSLNFSANGAILPEGCKLHLGDETYSVEIDWSPICSDDDIVNKVLVTLRDVTEVTKLREQSEQQERDILFLAEITKVDENKYKKFMSIAFQFTEENITLASRVFDNPKKTIESIYINLHTLKGISRTYGFKKISDLVHEEEELFAHSRSEEDAKKITHERIVEGQNRILELLNTYETISSNLLGRSKEESFVRMNKAFAKKKLHDLTRINFEDLNPDGKEILGSLKAEFVSYFFYDFGALLEDLVLVAETLSRDLKKASPMFEVKGDYVLFTQDGTDLLKQVFVHLIRNSMDHGIEPMKARLKAGKPEAGTMYFETKTVDDGLEIIYYDDGRGIFVDGLYQKAVQHGVVKEGTPLTPTEKANLMFEAGVSTAKSVTDISGRGVGMKAVQEFVTQAGGAFSLEVAEICNDGYAPFKFKIVLPFEYFRISDIEDAS